MKATKVKVARFKTSRENKISKIVFSKFKTPPQKILEKLHSLKDKKGLIATIEPETGRYFFGKTLTEALKKAKEKFPNKIFFSIRIGHSFIYEHKGNIKRLK
jgi:hypothetical protein